MEWKTIAIIFIILSCVLIGLITYSTIDYYRYNKSYNDCLYNFCAEYPDAEYYENGVCECYDYDNLGQLYVAKTRYK